ncbi:Choline dehydrogenase [Mycena kentingensis (nom. inval.)]|nr:Choline dehydrogenase [Mycena kentingensis (nom. inval.)]
MLHSTILSSLLALVLARSVGASAHLPSCPTTKADYDFVVVGAGAGGGPAAARLAENGFSVLLVDAGTVVDSVNTTIPFYFGRAVADPKLELNYTYNEYSPGAKFPRNDAWYPRARGVGGSTIHNALANHVGATRQDFDAIEKMFGDKTWSYDNLRNYFKKIEHSLTFNASNPDHGFDGWLKTSLNPAQILASPMFADTQLNDVVNTVSSLPPTFIPDLNSVSADAAEGVGLTSFTIDENHLRSSIYNRLEDLRSKNLHFALNTLATKIALCSGHNGRPRAYGVELARGAALAVAGNFHGKQRLVTELVTARYEVIVGAGVFQTPQLLMLSGIGDSKQLTKHGIDTVANLPGVGQNLQDHDEVAIVWRLKQNHTVFANCTVLYTPKDDPCLKFWIDSHHQNLYSFGGALLMLHTRSATRGARPRHHAVLVPGIHNALTTVLLKRQPSTRGSVELTGNHPQDPLHIEKRHFEAPGGEKDLAALRQGIKLARKIAAEPGIAEHIEMEVFGPDGAEDEDIENHILQNVYGHHACCTAAMGPDDDPNAVLDGDFRVRGVDGLRVVDISSWPNVPGWFVTTTTYMVKSLFVLQCYGALIICLEISEKAADVIMAEYAR